MMTYNDHYFSLSAGQRIALGTILSVTAIDTKNTMLANIIQNYDFIHRIRREEPLLQAKPLTDFTESERSLMEKLLIIIQEGTDKPIMQKLIDSHQLIQTFRRFSEYPDFKAIRQTRDYHNRA